VTELVVEFSSSAYLTDTQLSRLKRIPGFDIEHGRERRIRDTKWAKMEPHQMIAIVHISGVPDQRTTYHLLTHFQGETDMVCIFMPGTRIIDVKFVRA
jgi:hypothetical protein